MEKQTYNFLTDLKDLGRLALKFLRPRARFEHTDYDDRYGSEAQPPFEPYAYDERGYPQYDADELFTEDPDSYHYKHPFDHKPDRPHGT